MKIDLNKEPQKITVCGYNGSGKTTLVRRLIEGFNGKVLVYDWHGEYKDMKGKNISYYIPKFKDSLEKRRVEFNEIIMTTFNNKKEFKLLVVDEANEYEPNKMQLTTASLDLYDNHRHYGQSIIWVCRRPTDLVSKLIEVAHLRIFFRLDGKNDLQYLDTLKKGLADIVSNLKPYEFCILDNFGVITTFNPIKI